jgi:hypothetical protein
MSNELGEVLRQIHAEWILAGRRVYSFRENLKEFFTLVKDRGDPRIAAIPNLKDPDLRFLDKTIRYEIIMARKESQDPRFDHIEFYDVLEEIFCGKELEFPHIEELEKVEND